MNNQIHPTAIIGDRVTLGKDNVILPYTVIEGPTAIGDNNIIGPHVTIGQPGQDTRNPRYDASEKMIIIGNNNIIREFTAIQKPCYTEETIVRNNAILMKSTLISHDSYIDDNVVITPSVTLGGHCSLLNGANIGLSATMHQFSVIGHYSMIAAGSTVLKNVKPFAKFIPNKPLKVNDYNIKKYAFEAYTDEIHKYVLEDIQPTSEVILAIVNRFEDVHAKSGRSMYSNKT